MRNSVPVGPAVSAATGWRAASAAALLFVTPAAAAALERACGPDPIANTAEVLCAAPAGPCDDATVRVTLGIDALPGAGPCTFDLEGRALVVEATLQTTADLRFFNAGDVTIAPTGKLKARGDFLAPAGFLEGGGLIAIQSAGTIRHSGLLDVSGYEGGTIYVVAAGDIVTESGGEMLSNALGPLEDGEHAGAGGTIALEARGGMIAIHAPLAARGQAYGDGGSIDLLAAHEVVVEAALEAPGGYGGSIDLGAGDRIAVRRSIDVASSGGGGDGGFIDIHANDGQLGGFEPDLVPGAPVEISSATLDLRGSATDGIGGYGGDLVIDSDGPLLIARDVAILLDGGPGLGGEPGSSELLTAGGGDLVMEGTISAHGGGEDAGGSFFGLEFYVDRNLVISGGVHTSGRLGGGRITAEAGGEMILTGTLSTVATSPNGEGGFIRLENGLAADASIVVDTDLIASGGAFGNPGRIRIDACTLDVRADRTFDERSGFAGTQVPIIRLRSWHPMRLGDRSRYLAGPLGQITSVHPAGADPIIGDGVVFETPLIDVVDPLYTFPPCPPAVCGNGVREHGEQCDDGDADDGDGCAADCRVRCLAAPAPDCRPGRATLVLRNEDGYARDTLTWKWRGGATTVADLGSPFTEDDYLLCLYDESASPALAVEAAVPAGALCGRKPCWQYHGREGVLYRSRERLPDGVATLHLKAGDTGKARIGAKGKGAHLPMPYGPLSLPARVQLQSEHGACWEAAYTTAEQNTGGRFKATSAAP